MIRELEFQVLSQRHCDEIYRFALGLLGNPADAEDATQEALLRLWNHLPRLNLFNIRGWLFQTTRNYCLDQIRRRSRAASPNSAAADSASGDLELPYFLDVRFFPARCTRRRRRKVELARRHAAPGRNRGMVPCA